MIYQVTTSFGTTRTVYAENEDQATTKVLAQLNAPIWVGERAAAARAAEDHVFQAQGGYLIHNTQAHVERVEEMQEVWMDAGYCLVAKK